MLHQAVYTNMPMYIEYCRSIHWSVQPKGHLRCQLTCLVHLRFTRHYSPGHLFGLPGSLVFVYLSPVLTEHSNLTQHHLLSMMSLGPVTSHGHWRPSLPAKALASPKRGAHAFWLTQWVCSPMILGTQWKVSPWVLPYTLDRCLLCAYLNSVFPYWQAHIAAHTHCVLSFLRFLRHDKSFSVLS